MQRYTMYYYVVVMLLCLQMAIASYILQRLRVHWERKKNAVGKLQATTSCLSFLLTNSQLPFYDMQTKKFMWFMLMQAFHLV